MIGRLFIMTKKLDLTKIAMFFKNIASEKNIDILRSFFMGKWYPIWIAFSVLIGRFTCTEVYFAMLDLVILSVALLVCDSLRPALLVLITVLFRMPIEHGPGAPYYSDYYTTATSVKVLIAFVVLAVVALVYFCIKNKIFDGFNPLKDKLFIPTLVFSATFLTAGLFSGNRQEDDLLFTVLEFLVFFVVFYVLYLGLRRENFDELLGYFIYIAAVCAVILLLQVFDLFLRVDGVVKDGSIDKSMVLFGWGVSNNMANALSILVPLLILGVMRATKKYVAIIFLGIAALNLVAIFFTLSRTSLLVGTVGFLVCIVISCFAGKQKRVSRIFLLSMIGGVVGVFICFSEKIAHIVARYVEKGFGDSGRFNFWRYFFGEFEKAPIFGNGFYHFHYGVQYTTFAPSFAHNTLIELLAAMGLVGFCAYLVYRAFTFIPFFKDFTLTKLLLLASCAVLIFESWLDNFIFLLTPTFVYNVCIILAVMHCEQTKRENLKDAQDLELNTLA